MHWTGPEGAIHKAHSALGLGHFAVEGVLGQEANIQSTGFSPPSQVTRPSFPSAREIFTVGMVLPGVETRSPRPSVRLLAWPAQC